MKVKNCHQEGHISPWQRCAAATEVCLPQDTQWPQHQRQYEWSHQRPWELLLPSSVYHFFKNRSFAFFPSFIFCFCPSFSSSAYLNMEFPTVSDLLSLKTALPPPTVVQFPLVNSPPAACPLPPPWITQLSAGEIKQSYTATFCAQMRTTNITAPSLEKAADSAYHV